mmetsp:Transcript_4023/g.8796  ORF Transcript_4023/g.8796 Transcript_4023/m.8796 type:complete len:203 (+) Transcript_4023:224-832(+)
MVGYGYGYGRAGLHATGGLHQLHYALGAVLHTHGSAPASRLAHIGLHPPRVDAQHLATRSAKGLFVCVRHGQHVHCSLAGSVAGIAAACCGDAAQLRRHHNAQLGCAAGHQGVAALHRLHRADHIRVEDVHHVSFSTAHERIVISAAGNARVCDQRVDLRDTFLRQCDLARCVGRRRGGVQLKQKQPFSPVLLSQLLQIRGL